MNLVLLAETFLIAASVISTFFVMVQHLIRFQRRIDRVLILVSSGETRLDDIEQFLEKKSEFRPRKKFNNSALPEIDTDFT